MCLFKTLMLFLYTKTTMRFNNYFKYIKKDSNFNNQKTLLLIKIAQQNLVLLLCKCIYTFYECVERLSNDSEKKKSLKYLRYTNSY